MVVKLISKDASEGPVKIKVLAMADVAEPQIYNASVVNWAGDVDLLVSCGDLPAEYLDYVVSTLNVPLLHVLGNHFTAPRDPVGRYSADAFLGACNLDGKVAWVVKENGNTTRQIPLIMAGVEGSPVYSRGPHQHTEQEIKAELLKMVPALLLNKMRTGRYLDVLVTHAPPRGIHDSDDVAHKGFKELIPFIERFKPMLLLHGHTHRYEPMMPLQTRYGQTEVINAYGHVLLDLVYDDEHSAWRVEKVGIRG